MPTNQKRDSFTLTIKPEHRDDDPQGVRRLRAVLKELLRRYGMRCTSVEREREEEATEADENAPVLGECSPRDSSGT